ncbi:hypothetical protein [Roseiflexus castenholzii]|uniref:hypothetical protein n=1 Tax=Roseiflexus castenholzii TaxID=120962 RepID=UPI003C7CC6E5
MKRWVIVTHTHPDADAALAAWIAARYLVPSDEQDRIFYAFVPAGQGFPGENDPDTTVIAVDTGGGAFDHHDEQRARDETISASSLTYQAALSAGNSVQHLKPLVDVVVAGDHGRAPEWSRLLGVHALISVLRNRHHDYDEQALRAMFEVFDLFNQSLVMHASLEREFQRCVVPVSNRVAFIQGGSSAVTRYALEQGYALILFETNLQRRADGCASVAVGIQRAEGAPMDCRDVVRALRALALDSEGGAPPGALEEIDGWYCHPSGFFAGRGTSKSRANPSPLDGAVRNWLLQTLVRLVDAQLRPTVAAGRSAGF